eukprot:GHVU01176846.1.p1 GENE.GHVU01176846.1~~GHVU01176846.1.p1  ORF type:complete len:416 (-),score=46.50 GHVU01176846.1:1449-2561(-)
MRVPGATGGKLSKAEGTMTSNQVTRVADGGSERAVIANQLGEPRGTSRASSGTSCSPLVSVTNGVCSSFPCLPALSALPSSPSSSSSSFNSAASNSGSSDTSDSRSGELHCTSEGSVVTALARPLSLADSIPPTVAATWGAAAIAAAGVVIVDLPIECLQEASAFEPGGLLTRPIMRLFLSALETWAQASSSWRPADSSPPVVVFSLRTPGAGGGGSGGQQGQSLTPKQLRLVTDILLGVVTGAIPTADDDDGSASTTRPNRSHSGSRSVRDGRKAPSSGGGIEGGREGTVEAVKKKIKVAVVEIPALAAGTTTDGKGGDTGKRLAALAVRIDFHGSLFTPKHGYFEFLCPCVCMHAWKCIQAHANLCVH